MGKGLGYTKINVPGRPELNNLPAVIMVGNKLLEDWLEESMDGKEVSKRTRANTAYVVCSTGASTAAKTVSIEGYELTAGGSIKVKFDNANTAASPTLNISGTGAKPLYYNGSAASSSNSWKAGETLEVYYDGTNFYANSISNILESPEEAGTSGQVLSLNDQGKSVWVNPAEGSVVDSEMSDVSENPVQNKVIKGYIDSLVAEIDTIAEGYIRVAGSSSPSLSYKSYKYHEQGGFGRESAFSLFYPCLVGTKLTGDDAQVGKILHVLKKLDWNHDIEGNARSLDGSEGDVMVCNVEPYYRIMGKHTISGTEYDVFLMSRSPFTFQGIEAEKVERYGIAPDYCVSHADTDSVNRMHSVYNPAWVGSYNAPSGVAGKFVFGVDPETGDITETYDENETLLGGSGGLHTTDLELYTGEQLAMNQNPDTTKTVPFMNQTAEMCNNMQALLLSEGGTFDAHSASLMGSGFSSNDAANAAADWEESGSGAKNGCRVMDKDGVWKYYSLASNPIFLYGETTGTLYFANCINSWRSPWHIMEAQRAISFAIQNGVHELEWFVFEGDKYKYRSVSGFNGPSQGEMTCVVWKLIATKAGAAAIDPTDLETSIAGNRVEFLVSTALLHGVTTQFSPSWWVSGLIFTEDENGAYKAYMERDQASLIKSESGTIDASSNFNFELHYPQIGEIISNGSGYAKNYLNGAMMMPDTNTNKTGGGLHTYVGKYNYFAGEAPAQGKKLVRGFRRGINAYGAALSPLYVTADAAPSLANSAIGFGTVVRIVE